MGGAFVDLGGARLWVSEGANKKGQRGNGGTLVDVSRS